MRLYFRGYAHFHLENVLCDLSIVFCGRILQSLRAIFNCLPDVMVYLIHFFPLIFENTAPTHVSLNNPRTRAEALTV